MKRATTLVCAFVVVLSLVAPARPAEGCGADGEWACWEKICLVRIFGKCVVPGWRLKPPNLLHSGWTGLLGEDYATLLTALAWRIPIRSGSRRPDRN